MRRFGWVQHLDFDPPQQRVLRGEDLDAPGEVEPRLALEPLGDAHRRPGAAREEARRLAALLESAMREARASGSAIAWSAERQGYAFWQRGDDGDWVPYPRTSLYRSRALAGRTELTRVRVDGRDLAPGERVVFSPYGLRSELSATMAGAGEQFTIYGDIVGRVSLARVYAN